jgi:hypothetical protein
MSGSTFGGRSTTGVATLGEPHRRAFSLAIRCRDASVWRGQRARFGEDPGIALAVGGTFNVQGARVMIEIDHVQELEGLVLNWIQGHFAQHCQSGCSSVRAIASPEASVRGVAVRLAP